MKIASDKCYLKYQQHTADSRMARVISSDAMQLPERSASEPSQPFCQQRIEAIGIDIADE